MSARRFHSEREVAELLGIHPTVVRKMRVRGDGPRFVKLNRRVIYDARDVESWVESQKVNSTAAHFARARGHRDAPRSAAREADVVTVHAKGGTQ